MPEITRPGQPTRQSIAPSTSAPSAPTMDTPGARTMTDPTTPTSRRREAATREKFEGIEREYGRSKFLSHRRDQMKIRKAPETPVSDAYVITMRKQGAAPGIVSLDDLVIQSEQREREQWLRDEEYRAAVLPHQIQAEVQQAAWHDSINQYYAQQNKAAQEQRERDTEAQKYGYETDAELQAAIREEKAIKRANELGLALTEAQLIAQTVAREGYTGATAYYGRDPGELIEEQRQIGAAAQASLEANFEITADPGHQGFFKEASDFTALHREAAKTTPPGSDPLVDDRLGLRLVKAGPPLKASDYPAPSVASGISTPEPRGPVAGFAQDIFRDVVMPGDVARAQDDYEGASRAYEERYKAAEEAGLLVGDEFIVTDEASRLQYEELRIAGEAVNRFGKEAEDLRKRELFGIPAKFSEMESGLAGT